jgi:hypothetical protein
MLSPSFALKVIQVTEQSATLKALRKVFHLSPQQLFLSLEVGSLPTKGGKP